MPKFKVTRLLDRIKVLYKDCCRKFAPGTVLALVKDFNLCRIADMYTSSIFNKVYLG